MDVGLTIKPLCAARIDDGKSGSVSRPMVNAKFPLNMIRQILAVALFLGAAATAALAQVTSLGGATGAIGLGAGLGISGSTLTLTFHVAAVCDWNGSTGTDNTTVIQNAINAAAAVNGARVKLPQGSCLTGTLTMGLGVWLDGEGPGGQNGQVGTTLVANTGLNSLFYIPSGAYGVQITNLGMAGNSTAGWAVVNDPGNSGGLSINNPTTIRNVGIWGFSQSGEGGIINTSGTTNVFDSLLQGNCYGFYNYDAGVSSFLLNLNIQGGGACGWQVVLTNNGNSNEGEIIQNGQFLGSAGESVNIHTCVLCIFENSVIGSTSGTRDLAVDSGRSIQIVGNYFGSEVAIGNVTASWFMRNSLPVSTVSFSGGQLLVMFNQFSSSCSYGSGVTAMLNTDAGCNNSTSLGTW